MKLNEQISRLRADGSGPEAKARTIARLQHSKEHKTMKLIGKVGIPAALVASLAIIGALSVPRTALASPASVAKAIRNIGSYVINSFTIVDGNRTLTSKTTVSDGKTSRQFYDEKGNPVAEGHLNKLDGAMVELAIGGKLDGPEGIQKLKGDGQIEIVEGHPIGGAVNGQSVEVKMTKDKDGKAEKHYFVNGKEVKELPADMKDKVHIELGTGGKGFTKDVSGGGEKEIGLVLKSGDFTRGGMIVVEGNENGETSMFQSGQTSVDYLLKLLENPSRWTITRGVNLNGEKLDKFTLNGPVSPIELYVDPVTTLPRLLRFVGPGDGLGPVIEDEYTYGAIPPK